MSTQNMPMQSQPAPEQPSHSAEASPERQEEAARLKMTERFDLLIQSGRELSSTFDPEVIFERLYTIVSHSMDCATFILSMYTPSDDLIRCAHARHDGEVLDASAFPPIPLQRDNPNATQSLAILTAKSILINDFIAHTRGKTPTYYVDKDSTIYDDTHGEEDVTRAVLIIPMILDNRVAGVIQVQSYRINAYSQDDLRFLEALAPQIAIVLQNATLHQRLQSYTAELEQRVEQRTEQLQQALEKATELADIKARFASMITHEFRNPLASIQMSADLLDQYVDRMTEEQRREHFHQIQTNIDHLKELIEQVLFISRAESMSVQAQLAPISAEQLCRKIISDMQLICPTHRLSLSVSGVDSPVMLDSKLIQQALSNLIANAVKYSPNSDSVSISLQMNTDLRIAVKDTGIGIPAADITHLFDTFFRGSNVGSITGTGLGLVVVKGAVEAHGGALYVESSPGAGTTFTLIIPVPKA